MFDKDKRVTIITGMCSNFPNHWQTLKKKEFTATLLLPLCDSNHPNVWYTNNKALSFYKFLVWKKKCSYCIFKLYYLLKVVNEYKSN